MTWACERSDSGKVPEGKNVIRHKPQGGLTEEEPVR